MLAVGIVHVILFWFCPATAFTSLRVISRFVAPHLRLEVGGGVPVPPVIVALMHILVPPDFQSGNWQVFPVLHFPEPAPNECQRQPVVSVHEVRDVIDMHESGDGGDD